MLSLPFFEPAHRELAGRLTEVVADVVEPAAADADAGDPNRAGREFLRAFAERGFLGLLVSAQYGGATTRHGRVDVRSLCLAREIVASASGLADAVFAVQGLGSYPIELAGSDALKARFLPAVASGDAIAAFALTEPNAGSDIGGIETTARADGDSYVLDGSKTLISNAGIADFYVVFAATSRPAGPDERKRFGAFLVEADTPGLTIAAPTPLMAPHPIGDLTFDRCRVPHGHRLGGETDGFRIALATLDVFRPTVGAAACGLGLRALREALAHTSQRRQFGRLLTEFQATRFALADIQTELDAARLLVYRAAWMHDQGTGRTTREASIAKLFATEAAQRAVDRALQLHGGMGVTRGATVERLYREVRALRLYEGTSEIQRLVIADQMLKPAE